MTTLNLMTKLTVAGLMFLVSVSAAFAPNVGSEPASYAGPAVTATTDHYKVRSKPAAIVRFSQAAATWIFVRAFADMHPRRTVPESRFRATDANPAEFP